MKVKISNQKGRHCDLFPPDSIIEVETKEGEILLHNDCIKVDLDNTTQFVPKLWIKPFNGETQFCCCGTEFSKDCKLNDLKECKRCEDRKTRTHTKNDL